MLEEDDIVYPPLRDNFVSVDDFKRVVSVLLRENPEYEEWILKNWKHLLKMKT